MAQFLSHLNLNGNQLQNVVIQPLATNPEILLESAGRFIFNTTEGRGAFYDGTKWHLIAHAEDVESIAGLAGGIDTRVKALEDFINTEGNQDEIINKWQEVVDFVKGYEEGDDLATIISGITSDVSTLKGYFNGGVAKEAAKVSNKLTFGTGAPSISTAVGSSFDGSEPLSINIPTSSDHLLPGSTNLFFTSDRAKAAVGLGSTAIGGTKAFVYWDGTTWKTQSTTDFVVSSDLLEYASREWVLEQDYLTSVVSTDPLILGVTDNNKITLLLDEQGGLGNTGAGLGVFNLRHSLTIGNKKFDGSAGITIEKADLGLGNVENTALSTWTGSTKIATLGTIKTGTWQGSKIANTYLANSKVTIAGTDVNLGGSITTATLAASLVGAGMTKKFAGSITNNLSVTDHVITHSLNTRDVVVMVYDPTTYEKIMVDIEMTDVNNVTLKFASAPTKNYRVVVIG